MAQGLSDRGIPARSVSLSARPRQLFNSRSSSLTLHIKKGGFCGFTDFLKLASLSGSIERVARRPCQLVASCKSLMPGLPDLKVPFKMYPPAPSPSTPCRSGRSLPDLRSRLKLFRAQARLLAVWGRQYLGLLKSYLHGRDKEDKPTLSTEPLAGAFAEHLRIPPKAATQHALKPSPQKAYRWNRAPLPKQLRLGPSPGPA